VSQVNVSLPDGIKGWVDDHVAKGLHSSPSDFIRDVLRQVKQEEEDLAWLRAEIDKGRESGPGRDAFEFFAELKQKYGSKVVAD
jgi:antitoxin ParD1/3/4